MDCVPSQRACGRLVITGLSLESLGLERGGRTLFSGLDLIVRSGEAVALVGANGAGKTSLLRAVAGLIRPAAGQVRFESGGTELEPEDARASGLHLLGHHDGLKTGRTAGEELAFWAAWLGGDDRGLSRAVSLFDLSPLLDIEVRRLSAGQRRRLALARLVASPRPLWLLDEPMAPLDADRRAQFGALMAAHIDGGGLILAAVHDPLPIPARNLVIGAGA